MYCKFWIARRGLRARTFRAGFRFVGMPRSSSARLLSDAKGDIGAPTRYSLHATRQPVGFSIAPQRSSQSFWNPQHVLKPICSGSAMVRHPRLHHLKFES